MVKLSLISWAPGTMSSGPNGPVLWGHAISLLPFRSPTVALVSLLGCQAAFCLVAAAVVACRPQICVGAERECLVWCRMPVRLMRRLGLSPPTARPPGAKNPFDAYMKEGFELLTSFELLFLDLTTYKVRSRRTCHHKSFVTQWSIVNLQLEAAMIILWSTSIWAIAVAGQSTTDAHFIGWYILPDLSKSLEIFRASHGMLTKAQNKPRGSLPKKGGPRLGRLPETVPPPVVVFSTQHAPETSYTATTEDPGHGQYIQIL